MGPSPLRRSKRGKSPDDGPATNVKLTEVKTANISQEGAKDVNEDENIEVQDPPEVSGRKSIRFKAIQLKSWFKPQRVRVELGT
nr:P-loop containing nucleoside triphosphate hydrolase [Tanacetum cinerariifolium]